MSDDGYGTPKDCSDMDADTDDRIRRVKQSMSREQVEEQIANVQSFADASYGGWDKRVVVEHIKFVLEQYAALLASLERCQDHQAHDTEEIVKLRAELDKAEHAYMELDKLRADVKQFESAYTQANLLAGSLRVENEQLMQEIAPEQVERLLREIWTHEHSLAFRDIRAYINDLTAQLAVMTTQRDDLAEQLMQAADKRLANLTKLATVMQERDALQEKYQDCCDEMNERKGWVSDLEQQLAAMAAKHSKLADRVSEDTSRFIFVTHTVKELCPEATSLENGLERLKQQLAAMTAELDALKDKYERPVECRPSTYDPDSHKRGSRS